MLRSRIYAILEARSTDDPVGVVINYGLLALIFLNVTAVMLESVETIHAGREIWFHGFEVFSIAVFTVEYGLRVWCRPGPGANLAGSAFRARLRYLITPMALIDLVAILPFFLSFLMPIDLRFLRVLRLARLLKLSRYSRSLDLLLQVLREEAKPIAAAVFVLLLLLVLAASFAYLAEHKVQPGTFGSIPQAMWWAIVTMTTVGYGDVTPVTALGKFVAGLVGIFGIGMVALPAGLLASGFTEKLHERMDAYEALVEDALDDGVVTVDEKAELAQAREQLGLSDEQAAHILRSKNAPANDTLGGCCPHCGQTLAPVMAQPAAASDMPL